MSTKYFSDIHIYPQGCHMSLMCCNLWSIVKGLYLSYKPKEFFRIRSLQWTNVKVSFVLKDEDFFLKETRTSRHILQTVARALNFGFIPTCVLCRWAAPRATRASFIRFPGARTEDRRHIFWLQPPPRTACSSTMPTSRSSRSDFRKWVALGLSRIDSSPPLLPLPSSLLTPPLLRLSQGLWPSISRLLRRSGAP